MSGNVESGLGGPVSNEELLFSKSLLRDTTHLRIEALKLALGSHPINDTDQILARAQTFYKFLIRE